MPKTTLTKTSKTKAATNTKTNKNTYVVKTRGKLKAVHTKSKAPKATATKPKGKPGRPRKVAVAPPVVHAVEVHTAPQPETTTHNDRLQAVFDHNGVPEPKSVPIPKPTQAAMDHGSVVMASPPPEPMKAVEPMKLPKPQASFDGQSVVMKTAPAEAPAPAPEPEKAMLKNEDGVLIIQQPINKID
jgi:hypothetical protein